MPRIPTPPWRSSDPEPEDDYWFNAAALTQRSLSSRLPVTGLAATVKQFARDNEFLYYRWSGAGGLEGVNFDVWPTMNNVALCEIPLVILGNYGLPVSFTSSDGAPSRMGFISIEHGLDLPHVVLPFQRIIGARTVTNVVANAVTTYADIAKLFSTSTTHHDTTSGVGKFKRRHPRVPLAAETTLVAHAAEDDHDRARALLTPLTWATLLELTDSFAVEIRPNAVVAYNYYGDVATRDPEVWAWVFSCMSRLLDLVALWQPQWPLLEDGTALEVRSVPGYTERRIERPERLDGVLDEAVDELVDHVDTRLKRRAARRQPPPPPGASPPPPPVAGPPSDR